MCTTACAPSAKTAKEAASVSTNASDANAKVSRTCSLGVHTRTHARVCVCVCVCVCVRARRGCSSLTGTRCRCAMGPDGRMKRSECLKTRDEDSTASMTAMAGLSERTGPAKGPSDEDFLEIALAAAGIHVCMCVCVCVCVFVCVGVSFVEADCVSRGVQCWTLASSVPMSFANAIRGCLVACLFASCEQKPFKQGRHKRCKQHHLASSITSPCTPPPPPAPPCTASPTCVRPCCVCLPVQSDVVFAVASVGALACARRLWSDFLRPPLHALLCMQQTERAKPKEGHSRTNTRPGSRAWKCRLARPKTSAAGIGCCSGGRGSRTASGYGRRQRGSVGSAFARKDARNRWPGCALSTCGHESDCGGDVLCP